MAIPVKLPVFEGPLDLLMHLIEKNKIDIYDIPIAEITDQYLDYVRQMDREDMDVTSEFLVMAATLLDIKSRMLLPREKDEETGEEEGDPREELVRRLLEYKKYRYLSEELAVRREQAGIRFFRTQQLPREVRTYQPPIDYGALLGNADLASLEKIFGEVLRRKKSRRDPIRSGFGKITRDEVNIDNKTLYIRAFLQTHPHTDFRALLESQESREEVIVTFLILLELMKNQKVHIVQDSIGGKILVEASGTAHADLPENGEPEYEAEFPEAEFLSENTEPEHGAPFLPGDGKADQALSVSVSHRTGVALSALRRMEVTAPVPAVPVEKLPVPSGLSAQSEPVPTATEAGEEPVPAATEAGEEPVPAATEAGEEPVPADNQAEEAEEAEGAPVPTDAPEADSALAADDHTVEDGLSADFSAHLWHGRWPRMEVTSPFGGLHSTGPCRMQRRPFQPSPLWERDRLSRLWARRRDR